jgi:hypothetical protein
VTPRARALTVLLALSLGTMAFAQRRGFFREYRREPPLHNVPYDGRFTFARVKYTTAPGGFWYQGMPSWSHGYPASEDNLLRILNEVTLLRGRVDGFNVLALDDPEIFKYPLIYQDNDPRKRLQMIVNYNTDISQYWEWSGRGLRPFDETNEAYKLGVNYVMYGMTR